jgi:hypothetical protein
MLFCFLGDGKGHTASLLPAEVIKYKSDEFTGRWPSFGGNVGSTEERNNDNMTMRILLPMLVLSIAGLAQDVRYNFAKDADFSAYKTYRWVDIQKDGPQVDQILDNELKSAIDAELATKGLQRVESQDANLAIGYQVAIQQEKQITSYDTGWGYGPGWRGGWYGGYGGGMSTSTTSTINVGAVALDMYDAGKKELVWRGVATKTINENAKPEKRSKNIKKGAAKLLKNYPPKVEK